MDVVLSVELGLAVTRLLSNVLVGLGPLLVLS